MPAIVALAIRSIIQMAVTLGIISFVQSYLIPLINDALVAIAEKFGATAEEAQDILANEYLQFAEQVGIGVLVLRAKTPTLIAEKLGFTSKGWVKRPLKPATQAKVTGATAVAESATATTAQQVEKIATTVAKTRGLSFDSVSKVANVIVAIVGVPVGVGLLITNTIDFGAWNSSAYQQSFQKFLSIFGLEPDKDSRNPRTTSNDVFNKIYSAFQLEDAISINDPYKGAVVPFTRDNLLDLADKIAAQIFVEKKQVKSKELMGAMLPLIKFGNKTTTTTSTTTSTTSSQASTATKVQVFSGVVSQGILGNGTIFTPRTNDMIDDVQELIDSSSINLANFLVALPSKVSYEIKIVSSITTKDGFTQRGKTQQIQVGTYSNGQPRYKTITNKFAVLYLYIATDKGTRTKIATVNVGPVNSVNFQPNSNDLNAVAGRLQTVATTQDPSVIKTVISSQPIVTTPPVATQPPLPNYNTQVKIPGDLGYAFYMRPSDGSNPPRYVAVPDYNFNDTTFHRIPEDEYRRATGDTGDYTNSGYQIVNGVFTQVQRIPVVTTYGTAQAQTATTAPPATRLGANALTLNEWYIANGQSLPTVQARSVLYEQYGLGNASLYIGSAEQNTKLLNKLKGL